MTERTKTSGRATTLTISPEMLRTLGWFLLRLTISCVIVGFVISAAHAPLEHLIARGARNLLALVSSPYYVKAIEFFGDGYGYTSWIGPLRGGFKMPSLLFTFGFPIAYAFALPGLSTRRYWLRAGAVILIAYFVCTFAVLIVCDARLTSAFLQFGIILQPEWRHEMSLFFQYYLWMFTVRLYPLLMVVILALVSGQFRSSFPEEASDVMRRFNWTVAGTLALLLGVTIGSNPIIEARIERVEGESISTHIASIEDVNLELGPGLYEMGKWLEKQRDWKGAFEAYRHAVNRLRGKPRKQARKARDRVHERIKIELLVEGYKRKAIREKNAPR